jgi:hypothetical protein
MIREVIGVGTEPTAELEAGGDGLALVSPHPETGVSLGPVVVGVDEVTRTIAAIAWIAMSNSRGYSAPGAAVASPTSAAAVSRRLS